MALDKVISQIAQYNPVAAERKARVEQALQQAQTGLTQTRAQLLPQQVASQIKLAQLNAQNLAEQRKANLGLNEMRVEMMLQKMHQKQNAPTPGQEAFQKADSKALATALPDMSAGSDISERVLADLNEMKKNYGLLGVNEKGVLLGHVPAVTNAAQAFDRAQKDLVINLTGQMKNIRSTDALRKLIIQSKVGRNFREDAFNEGINSLGASANRIINKNKYFGKIAGGGISGFSAASRGWNEYISHYPLVDPQSGEILQNNVGKSDQFGTPDAVQKLNSGQYVLPIGTNPPTIPSVHGRVQTAPQAVQPQSQQIDGAQTVAQSGKQDAISQAAREAGIPEDQFRRFVEQRRR